MKVRESGMPEEELWESFFDAPAILAKLGLEPGRREVVEIGCGYGTFTLPAARAVSGRVYAFDIEPEMVAATQAKARQAGLTNVQASVRDVVAQGTGLPDSSVDYFMLFNILHAEDPLAFLREAFRVLRPGGRLSVIHWNYDAGTPRGPSMEIRPRPEHCQAWAESAGFRPYLAGPVDLPPHHYGLVYVK